MDEELNKYSVEVFTADGSTTYEVEAEKLMIDPHLGVAEFKVGVQIVAAFPHFISIIKLKKENNDG